MNYEFKEQVWKAHFRPTEDSYLFEDKLRKHLGFSNRYESARLLLGRSLAERTPVEPLPKTIQLSSKGIAGEFLFGDELDLWLSIFILAGDLGPDTTIETFRALVEAHWHRGAVLVREEFEACGEDAVRLLGKLTSMLPEGTETGKTTKTDPTHHPREIRLRVGPISLTYPDERPIDFAINGPGTSPHIALMGAVGKGKTMTGMSLAGQLVECASIPVLCLDPKGDEVIRRNADALNAKIVEVGRDPIPLDFLPPPNAPDVEIQNVCMRLRDTIARCCRSAGDLQRDLLRSAIERVVRSSSARDLDGIRQAYETELKTAQKKSDSILSRLNELTALRCFVAELQPAEFFSRSWIVSLSAVQSDELKRLILLLLLDATAAYVMSLSDSAVVEGHRQLRHLLVIDEARRILAEKKYESLADLVRLGRSKGSVVMLLSQDPSDFEGQADDFTTQIGTAIAFACAQSSRGLRALRGVYGRALQANEFSDVWLPDGVAFCKLPGRQPERIRCWQPGT